ncbi:ATP synthase F0 subunit B [Erysipelothrix inopinata]|uniref:ATP synthase subunit b n=1 Tax=Erysipelothrix inopinata TaxID=225084 RepID=A0A7G9RZA2_9FIRM|nr:ATP synthase F0 subunit B [Erysipelothrix inopinata]QNN60927.1 ATP synthase F0 subunit B [Erysipelothrix inopinata]
MDLNIAEKLFPQIATMLAQLGATFVIYLMYRKYLYEPVQKYLDKRATVMEEEMDEAKKLKEESLRIKEQSDEAYVVAMDKLKEVEKTMLAQAEKERAAIVESAQDEIRRQENQLKQDFEQDKKMFYKEMSQYLLETAVSVNQKVLEDQDIDSDTLIPDFQKELRNYDHQH